MITQEKIKEFQQELKNGISKDDIRERMRGDGYADKDIAAVLESNKFQWSWYLALCFLAFATGFYKSVIQRDGSFLWFVLAAALFVLHQREIKKPGKEEPLQNN